MTSNRRFRIAVMPGDGIGPEVMDAALAVLDAAVGGGAGLAGSGFILDYERLVAGAEAYRDTGVAMSEEVFEQARAADAILFGAMGLPDVRYADGTEIAPQLDLRFRLGLYAGIRPVRALPGGGARPLSDPRARIVDLVIVRESTEGLFASRGEGRRGGRSDRPRHHGDHPRDLRAPVRCELPARRGGARRTAGRAGSPAWTSRTCSPPWPSSARSSTSAQPAFRPRIRAPLRGRSRPSTWCASPGSFDVMVTENMFGDILSDLAAALAGGMGMAPSADVGDDHALFQPAHGERAGHRRAGNREPHRHDPVRGDDARLVGRTSRRPGVRGSRPAHRRCGGHGARRRTGPPGRPRRHGRHGSRHPRRRRCARRFRIAEPRVHRPASRAGENSDVPYKRATVTGPPAVAEETSCRLLYKGGRAGCEAGQWCHCT